MFTYELVFWNASPLTYPMCAQFLPKEKEPEDGEGDEVEEEEEDLDAFD